MNGLFAFAFGESTDYLTRKQGETKRKAIGNGALVCAIIWLLCLFGEVLLPPLKVVRMYFQEAHWIAGKVVLGLLALPVGFPIAYTVTRRHFERHGNKDKEPEIDGLEINPEVKIAMKAREVQRLYEIIVGIGLWGWFWFLSPARDWMERSNENMLAQTMILFFLWLALAVVFGIGGGRIVYACAVKRFRHKG